MMKANIMHTPKKMRKKKSTKFCSTIEKVIINFEHKKTFRKLLNFQKACLDIAQ